MKRILDKLTPALFLSPALILFIVFLIIPFCMAIGLSFTDQRLVPNLFVPTEWVGLRNYIRLFGDEVFYRSVLNCFIFVVVVVPLQTSFALFLAVMINQKLKGVKVFRTIYFTPVVVSMAVVCVVWAFLYHPHQGLINEMIHFLSLGLLGPYDWLHSKDMALFAIIILSIWQGVGFQMIVYLAGLQEISADVYKAAEIDGANRFHKFFYITLPLLKNTHIFLALTTTILAFKLFTQVWIMQGPAGYPEGSTMTMMVHTVSQGFRHGKIGYASAITVVFFLIVLAVSLIQRRLITRNSN